MGLSRAVSTAHEVKARKEVRKKVGLWGSPEPVALLSYVDSTEGPVMATLTGADVTALLFGLMRAYPDRQTRPLHVGRLLIHLGHAEEKIL